MICDRLECQVAGGCQHRTANEFDCQFGWRWSVTDELFDALDQLKTHASSVWFDEATASNEEHAIMGKARVAIARAQKARSAA